MTKPTIAGAAAILSLVCLVPAASLFAEGSARPTTNPLTRELSNSLGGSINPLGLQDAFDASWRRPLFDSRNIVLSDAHVAFGLSQRLTPAYDRVGVWVEVSPLSVLDIRAGVEPVVYFGTFKSLLYFPEYSARFDDDTRKARGDEAAFGLAGRVYLAPTLKAKVGSILVRAHAELEWWRARETEKGRFFYEPGRDTLLRASGDAMMTSETMLLYQITRGGGEKLLLGPVHDLTWVYEASMNRKQDVGLAAIWVLGNEKLGMRQPTIFAKVFYYLEDPFKKHELGAQIAVGFKIGRPRGSR